MTSRFKFTLSILILSYLSFASADTVRDSLREIVDHGCNSVAQGSSSSSVANRCFDRGRILIESEPTRVGEFIINLCDSLPTGGLFSKNSRWSCLVGVARDSSDPVLKAIFKKCSGVVIRESSIEAGEFCFIDEYRSL